MSHVVVVGVGMMSAVGLSAPEVAASVRAGVTRFEESALLSRAKEPFVLASVPEAALPVWDEGSEPGASADRELRLARLAAPPLAECLEPLPDGSGPVPLLLALPEDMEVGDPAEAAVLERLARHVTALDGVRSEASFRGRAGGLAVLGRGAELLGSGAPFVVVGGVDSFHDPALLGRLDREGRVQSPLNLDGFIPGEGAGFLLLTSEAMSRTRGPTPLLRAATPAQGFEPGHLYSEEVYLGEGLADVVRRATETEGRAGPVQEVFSSMNGESHWGKEWGVAALRSAARLADGHGMHHPAEFYGDVGAAAAPSMVALAALGIRDGYRSAPALVYGSSDAGPRAAVVLHAP